MDSVVVHMYGVLTYPGACPGIHVQEIGLQQKKQVSSLVLS